MQTPQSFYLFLRYMSLRDRDVRSNQLEWFASALRGLDRKKIIELRNYLVKLLASDADEAKLRKIFEGGAFHIVWHTNDSCRQFLTQLRDCINVNE